MNETTAGTTSVYSSTGTTYVPSIGISNTTLQVKPTQFKVSGMAVRAGISKNGIKYTEENLKLTAHELNDKPILKDHNAKTDSVIGRTTKAEFKDTGIIFEGWVKEDGSGILDRIADGRIKEVSIGAIVEKLVKESADDDVVIAEGIHYLELSTTPTPGVTGTSISPVLSSECISPQIVERIKAAIDDEEDEDTNETVKKQEVNSMADEKQMPDLKVLEEENKKLKAELEAISLAKKQSIAESIAKLNPELKTEQLMHESDDKLLLIKGYEERIAKTRDEKVVSKANVVEDAKPSIKEEFAFLSGYNVTRQLENVKPGQIVMEKAGGATLIYKMPDYSKQGFNAKRGDK